jgi:hypothetical protein
MTRNEKDLVLTLMDAARRLKQAGYTETYEAMNHLMRVMHGEIEERNRTVANSGKDDLPR